MTELFPKLGGKHRVPDSGILMELKGDTAPVNEVDVHCVAGSDLGPKGWLGCPQGQLLFLGAARIHGWVCANPCYAGQP